MRGTPTLLILLLYGVFLALTGVWAGRQVRTAADFYVAGRRLGPGMLAASVTAANIGAGTTVGAAWLAYTSGASAWWWVGSAAIGTLILAFWFGPLFWEEARSRDCFTVGDYLESRFGRGVRGLSMTILWVGTLAILAAQLVAMGIVFNVAAGVPLSYCTVIGGLIVLVYYSAGGLWSSSVVNVAELAVKLVAFPLALLFAARTVAGEGGIGSALRAAAASSGMGDAYLSPVGIGGTEVLGMFLVLAPAFVVSPGLLQKSFGARDARTVRRGVALAGIVMLFFAVVPTGLGMLARVQWPDLTEASSQTALPLLLVEATPGWVGLLALAALLSAELSSADAVLFMLSTSFSRDLYQGHLRPDIDDRGLLLSARVAAAVGLALGLFVALGVPSVIANLRVFYGLLVIAMVVPLFAGMFAPRVGSTPTLASMIVALLVAIGTIVWHGGAVTASFWPFLFGTAAGAVTCTVVTAWRPR